MQMAMAKNDDLNDILDSALDDFRIADGVGSSNPRVSERSSVSREGQDNATLGEGLGVGLPALGSKEKSPGPLKALPSSDDDESLANSVHLADTLEELAQQTRQTLEGLVANDQKDMADKLVESIVMQVKELGGSQDVVSIMEAMMQQVLSKEVLHEPMKELCEKYPTWLEANKSSISGDDFCRYSRQYECIKELCGVYESTPDDFHKIVDLMQNMQACGQPPNNLVQELAPGTDLGGDNLPFLPDFLQ
eukprot:c22776_g1_i2 orf=167-913(-)